MIIGRSRMKFYVTVDTESDRFTWEPYFIRGASRYQMFSDVLHMKVVNLL